MNLILDTHTFIWWDSDISQMSQKARHLVEDTSNTIYLSMASVWEIQIKRNIGKLETRKPIAQLIRDQQKNGIKLLSISLEHLIALESIGDFHRDPFDRLIIAQALTEELAIITKDKAFRHYDVPLVWN